ncbi:MAG: cobalamin-binding protein, partial [Acidobacteria bacterium]|nr:cobalamin-binding protein [Acidobacteriota bacterium]
VSALLTTTMPAMKDTVDALNASKDRARFKVLVGGAPITQDFANQIQADSYAPDAASAAKAAKALIA